MSHSDSKDEALEKLLHPKANDSEESKIIKKKDGYDDYYSDEAESDITDFEGGEW